MKLATLRRGGRDGRLVVVSRDLARCVPVPGIAPTLQAALDEWGTVAPRLAERAAALESGDTQDAMPFDPAQCAAPLPRAYHWVDGSAYVNHVELVRKARGAEMPASFWTDPLVYQGGSDDLLGARDAVPFGDESWGIDLEAEIAVITDDVPMGTAPAQAATHVRLVTLVNDWSLRNLIPGELAKGFGFYQSKPSTSFAPKTMRTVPRIRCFSSSLTKCSYPRVNIWSMPTAIRFHSSKAGCVKAYLQGTRYS